MDISTFDELLQAARARPVPQRLLFVLAGAELPDDSTPAQRAAFEAGEGGALVPLMCVDKLPEEMLSFAAFADEARQLGPRWSIVFASTMAGTAGRAPSSADAEAPLQRMVDAIKRGEFGACIPFDTQGQAVYLG